MSQKLINGILSLGLAAALLFVGVLAAGSQRGATPKDTAVRFGVTLVNYFEKGVRWTEGGLYVGTDAAFQVDTNGTVTTTSATSTENGVTTVTYRDTSMTQASTTLCSFGPTIGTTTLERFVADITAGTTTASTLTLATSTSPSASTSPIATKTVAAGAQVTFDWHPGAHNSVVSPGTYINLTQAGGIGGTFSNTGVCAGRVQSVN